MSSQGGLDCVRGVGEMCILDENAAAGVDATYQLTPAVHKPPLSTLHLSFSLVITSPILLSFPFPPPFPLPSYPLPTDTTSPQPYILHI